MLTDRIFLKLSFHSIIAPIKSSRWRPVSPHDLCMQVFTGRPILVCPWAEIYGWMSLINVSSLTCQCPACLACLSCMLYEMGGKWLYSSCFADFSVLETLKTPRIIFFLLFPSRFCSRSFVKFKAIWPYNNIDKNNCWSLKLSSEH